MPRSDKSLSGPGCSVSQRHLERNRSGAGQIPWVRYSLSVGCHNTLSHAAQVSLVPADTNT